MSTHITSQFQWFLRDRESKKAEAQYGEYPLFHTGVLNNAKALSFGHKHHMKALSTTLI